MSADSSATFVSYSRADSEFALKLAEDLKAAGANVWIDQLDIEPGTHWDRAVEDALFRCPSMLVILSTVSANSENVRDEISFALNRQKRIIPVLYRQCEIPLRLARVQRIDFTADYARGLKMLLAALKVEQKQAEQAASVTLPANQTDLPVATRAQVTSKQDAPSGKRKPKAAKRTVREAEGGQLEESPAQPEVNVVSEAPVSARVEPETKEPPIEGSLSKELSPPIPFSTAGASIDAAPASHIDSSASLSQLRSRIFPLSPVSKIVIGAVCAGLLCAFGSFLLWRILDATLDHFGIEGFTPWTCAIYTFHTAMTGFAVSGVLLWIKPEFRRIHAIAIIAAWISLALIEAYAFHSARDLADLDYMPVYNTTSDWFRHDLMRYQLIVLAVYALGGLITGLVLAWSLNTKWMMGMIIGGISFAVTSFFEPRLCVSLELHLNPDPYARSYDPYFAITTIVLLLSAMVKVGALLWLTRDWTQESARSTVAA